jgi:hypothetical protein
MRVVVLLMLAFLVSCGSEPPVSPDLEQARAAARARADAGTEAAKAQCRARGEEVVEFQGGEWLCGRRAVEARTREEEAWRERCAQAGQQLYRSGFRGWYCARPTSDAGAVCRRGTDCQGACLIGAEDARAGQCSAVTPVPGCVLQIGADGRRGRACAP